MRKIEFFRHNLTAADFDAARNVLRSIFLTTGPVTARFEKKFAAYLGIREAVCLASCTGALHLALLRHGLGPGDEVITTPLTFVATVSPPSWRRARGLSLPMWIPEAGSFVRKRSSP